MKVQIKQDEDPSSPREWSNLGIMVCFHQRYDLGDGFDVHGLKARWFEGWDEIEAHLRRPSDEDDPEERLGAGKGAVCVLPLYLLDHSGITMNTTGFACPWDSGQVGYIYTTEEKLKEIGVDLADAEKRLKREVKVYDQYLTGDCWGYTIEDDDGEHLDSCWGYYGRDDAEGEAQAAFEALQGESPD